MRLIAAVIALLVAGFIPLASVASSPGPTVIAMQGDQIVHNEADSEKKKKKKKKGATGEEEPDCDD